MSKYKKIILDSLIDKYEDSLSYIGANRVNQNITFAFNKKNINGYFSESNNGYYEINDLCYELQDRGLIKIKWKNNKEGHIIDRVILNKENVAEAYVVIDREEKKSKNNNLFKILNYYRDKHMCLNNFILFIETRIEENKSIKQYIDLDNLSEVRDILDGVYNVLINEDEIFLREFSIKVYNDSKKLERLAGKIKKIIVDFSNKEEFLENEDIFSEFAILKNPSYVYFKGSGEFNLNTNKINLEAIPNGIGISSLDIENIEFVKYDNINSIVTIENLTSYNRFNEKNTLIIYLGGYHNKARRNLLNKLYLIYNDIEFYHWGDIDAGGFKIFNHLKSSTNINFKPMNMNKDILIKYSEYRKELTLNDRKELIRLNESDEYSIFKDIIEYMLKNNIKLEQEIIF
ncbi:MAG: DUF2220 family protein [Clostridium sp.]|nr:DUF2220 family protein [Clostridium sp.]